MESLLLFIVVVLLWLDLDEEKCCRREEAGFGHPRLLNQFRRADSDIERLTDQAVCDMLDEARRYEPGARR
jgi:hypothetical protein